MATTATKKRKRIRHKPRLGMAEIEEAFKHISTEALHGLVGWLTSCARGDETTEGSREIREELSRYLETEAAYDRKYRAEDRRFLCVFKPTMTDERLSAIAGDYNPDA